MSETGDPLAFRIEDADGAADPLPDEPRTELGYAKRLVHVYGDRLRFVPEWKRWLVWTGQRWEHDITGQSARWAKVIARWLTADALAIEDRKARENALIAAKKAETSASITAVLKLASTEEPVVACADVLDADPFLLNTPGGVLDLRTGELWRHDPALLLTKMTAAAYEPYAEGPAFTGFLERVQPDAGMRAFLARLLGHALEGRVTEHVLPIFHGEGSNGKSTLVNAVMAALGDYAEPADPELLTARTFDAHPTGTADLYGLRLAVLHESDAGRRLAEGTVKRLTGGDRLKARRMREDFWSFIPSHTFIALTNHKPLVTGTDEGIWRRLRLVPWEIVIPAEERDERLGERLAAELEAVMAWLVAGYQDWHQNGLSEPQRVADATASLRSESDAVGRFLDEQCVTGHGIRAGSTELFHAWQKWCAEQGEEAGSQKALAASLVNRGFDRSRDGAGRFRWTGLGLIGEEP